MPLSAVHQKIYISKTRGSFLDKLVLYTSYCYIYILSSKHTYTSNLNTNCVQSTVFPSSVTKCLDAKM